MNFFSILLQNDLTVQGEGKMETTNDENFT